MVEIELIAAVRTSPASLRKALQGLFVMSADLDVVRTNNPLTNNPLTYNPLYKTICFDSV